MGETKEQPYFDAYNSRMSDYYHVYILPDRVHVALTKILSGGDDYIDADRFKPVTPKMYDKYRRKLKKYEEKLAALPEGDDASKEEHKHLKKKVKKYNRTLKWVTVIPRSAMRSVLVKKKLTDCGLSIELNKKKKVLFFSKKDVRRYNFDKSDFGSVCDLFQNHYGDILTIEGKCG